VTAANKEVRGCASVPRPLFCPLPRIDGIEPLVSIDGPTSIELAYPGHARLPALVPVFSLGAGRIVQRDVRAELAVQIAHGKGWASRYTGLAFAMLSRGQPRCGRRITAGDLLGYVRRERARIRVELLGQDLEPRDVLNAIAGWSLLPWFAERSAVARLVPPRPPCALDRTIQTRTGRDLDVGA
jgi:hypothetical protein